jgi:uncharacterized repeat protein (TIGR04076 family)
MAKQPIDTCYLWVILAHCIKEAHLLGLPRGVFMPWHEIEIEIVNILESGNCPNEHKIGDKFEWPDDRGKICASAVHAIYPYITAMRAGGAFPWEKDPDTCTICCPDPNNPVVFTIRRGDPIE